MTTPLTAAIEEARVHAQRIIDNPNSDPGAEAMAIVMLVDLEKIEQAAGAVEVIPFLQKRRADALRALRACEEATPDYWRWQGHAEVSRQALERLGAHVPD